MDAQFVDDLEAVIARARAAGVTRILIPGIDVATSEAAVQIAEAYDGVYAAVGIHPESAKDVQNEDFDRIESLATHPKVVAIGEIGLDYYWETAPRETQKRVLQTQIEIARKVKRPIIIHNREATADTVALLEASCQGTVRGVMHCFTGSYETALQCIRMGFFISYGGPVTFKNARNVHEVAARTPAEALLVETDSPYLTPHPFRGKRNEPAYVRYVAEQLAVLRNESVDELVARTTQNALHLFSAIQA